MQRVIVLVLLYSLGMVSLSTAQSNQQFAPSSLHISWQLVDNYYKQKPQYLSTLTLLNNGDRPIPASGCSLYVNNLAGKDQTGDF